MASRVNPACNEKVAAEIEQGDFEKAEYCVCEELGDLPLRETIRKSFGGAMLEKGRAALSHERRSVLRVFKGAVLTPNYDSLFKRAYREMGQDLEVL